MEPRLISIKNGIISTENEVFELDITHYSDASDLEDYFTKEFKDLYEYPLHSFIFYPRCMVNLFCFGNKNPQIKLLLLV